jgi:hypothetical protein
MSNPSVPCGIESLMGVSEREGVSCAGCNAVRPRAESGIPENRGSVTRKGLRVERTARGGFS